MVRCLMWIYFQVCSVLAAPPGAAVLWLLADVLRDADGMHLADVRDSQKQVGRRPPHLPLCRLHLEDAVVQDETEQRPTPSVSAPQSFSRRVLKLQ